MCWNQHVLRPCSFHPEGCLASEVAPFPHPEGSSRTHTSPCSSWSSPPLFPPGQALAAVDFYCSFLSLSFFLDHWYSLKKRSRRELSITSRQTGHSNWTEFSMMPPRTWFETVAKDVVSQALNGFNGNLVNCCFNVRTWGTPPPRKRVQEILWWIK